MSSGATEPGRTGRGSRRENLGEAAPSERQPEDETPVDEGANEIGAGLPIYFTKARGKELWHIFDAEHDQIGKCYRTASAEPWRIKLDGVEVPEHITTFKAAVSAHAFVLGWAYSEGLLTPQTAAVDHVDGRGGVSTEATSGSGASGSAVNAGPAVGG